jgi:hypothetical protein
MVDAGAPSTSPASPLKDLQHSGRVAVKPIAIGLAPGPFSFLLLALIGRVGFGFPCMTYSSFLSLLA